MNTFLSVFKLKSDIMFADLNSRLSSNPTIAKKANGVFLINITDEGKTASQWSKYFYKISM